MTALYGGVTLSNQTGLLQQKSPTPIGFGVAQLGTDIAATVGSGFDGPFGTFMTPTPIWAGESPQFVGLDQVNVAFPTCMNAPATKEKRFDAFLTDTSIETGTTIRIYLPFLIRAGDPDCQWLTSTTTTLTSSLNPSSPGQSVSFTANVSPSTATGTVTFFDGAATLGSVAVVSGKATFSTAGLSAGSHSIMARYSGDNSYSGSTSAVLSQGVNAKVNTTTTLTYSPVPGGVTFTANVSQSGATGVVMFFESGVTIGSAPLGQPIIGGAQLTGELALGVHAISATYIDDTKYTGSTSQVVLVNGTTTTLASTPNPSSVGQQSCSQRRFRHRAQPAQLRSLEMGCRSYV